MHQNDIRTVCRGREMTVRLFRKAVEVGAAVNRFRKIALRGTHIFNPDKLRRQQPIRKNDSIVRKSVEALRNRKVVRASHYLGGAVVLHSAPGCKQQMWHVDYDPDEVSNKKVKPMGAILALEDHTRFITPSIVYTMNRGDLLCFDGDDVHAGAAYERANTRLHMYIDVSNVNRPKNRTWLITPDAKQ